MMNQAIANHLMKIEKHRVDGVIYDLNLSRLIIPLSAPELRTEEFILDINRGTIQVKSHKIQQRVRTSIPLVRVDLSPASPHKNPDGKWVRGSHIHLYQEGYDLRWAYPLPYDGTFGNFADQGGLLSNLEHFFGFCNISNGPFFQGGLI